MSYYNGPKIVTEGLVLYLDAGNSKSYPGTGTTWNDLSGNNNNGTLTNNPSYSSNNKGYFIFNGSNYVLLPTNFFSYPSLTTLTFSLWFLSTQSTGGTLFGQQSTNNPSSSPSGFVPVIYLTSNGIIRVEPFWTLNANNTILSLSALNNNIWHNIAFTYQSGICQLYIDGVYQSQRTSLSLNAFTSTYYYILGAGHSAFRGLGTHYFNGNISMFSMYNKSLSQSEIIQNYNALKGRFNL